MALVIIRDFTTSMGVVTRPARIPEVAPEIPEAKELSEARKFQPFRSKLPKVGQKVQLHEVLV